MAEQSVTRRLAAILAAAMDMWITRWREFSHISTAQQQQIFSLQNPTVDPKATFEFDGLAVRQHIEFFSRGRSERKRSPWLSRAYRGG